MKIVLEKGQRLFFTSDTHYGHSNICRATTNWTDSDSVTRDFKSLEHMNDTLVNRINETVGEDDILIHLGDFSFGGFENIEEFRSRIFCKNIHLVHGNHDHHIRNNRENIQDRFISVSDYLQVRIYDQDFVLSHYPFASWNGLNKGVIHLHGHVHLSNKDKWGKGKRLDVGVDGNGLFPYSLSEIVHMMDRRDVRSDMDIDHHLDDLVGVVG